MQLKSDAAVLPFGLWIRVIDHLHPIQAGDIPVAFHFQQILIPVIATHYDLVLRSRPYDPAAPHIIDSSRMLPQPAIDLELRPLRNIGRSGLEVDVEEHAAVSIGLAFELEGQMEI